MRKTSLLIVFTFIFSFALRAQLIKKPVDLSDPRFTFDPTLDYDPLIPDPAAFLGYQAGENFTVYEKVVNYFNAMDELSPRISVGEYGSTYEGRPLIYAVITSKENQDNIDEIKAKNLEIADPRSTSSSRLNTLIRENPVVVSYSYNIHGNEASTTEAAMHVAYRLIAAQDEDTGNLLKNTVLLMFPCINPDGRDRYVYWYKSMRSDLVATNPEDIAHDEPWPQGRTNHYWFDLNRDWIWGVHPESRGHTAIYQQWMPQVHTDYHEQGYNNNYFTMPGTTPRNLTLPDQYEALSDTFGMANIKAFDENQISYFTREAFDFFYPGYGSSYPSVMGAIGMLTEQGGIGAGRAIETEDGYVLTLRQRIFDHYLTSMATLEKAYNRKDLFMRYSYQAHQPANSKVNRKTYILPDAPEGYLYEVVRILLHHGIEVEKSTASFSVGAATDYRTGQTVSRNFPAGTWMVKADQPNPLFISAVLERNLAIEDSVMYDMSTWSAPLAYNLEAYASNKVPGVATERVTTVPSYPTGVENPGARYAYVMEWNQRFAPRALSLLWQSGYRVRSAQKPFTIEGTSFSSGSIIILQSRNYEKTDRIGDDMERIASTARVKIVGTNTGRSTTGIDLSSRRSRPVSPANVALLVDEPFSTYTAGQLWFLLERESALPITRIRASQLNTTSTPKFGSRYGYASLDNYDVLILPGARNLDQVFNEEALSKLAEWVRAGGVLVATENASAYFTKEESAFTNVEMLSIPTDSSEAVKTLSYAGREEYFGKKRIPGAALNVANDITHPLAFGLPEQAYTLKFGNDALLPGRNLQSVSRYAENDLLVAGYASSDNLEQLNGKTMAGVVELGEGQVVLIADNTQYRMFWLGMARMIQNASFLMPGM